MTETHAVPPGTPTSPPGTPIFPPGRYGRRRDPRPHRRWQVVAVAVVAALGTLAVSVRLFQQYGQPEFQPTVQRYFDVTDDGVTVQFEVRKAGGAPAICRVRARSATGVEVGRADVDAPPGRQVTVTYRLPTSARPAAVEVPACGPRR